MATVLVVEDDKLSQRILGKILGGAGHETLVADNVEQAWELLRRHGVVDLIILDNQLGAEWGWVFLQGLRVDPVFGGVPVVIYTAHTERSSILKYVDLGVHAMLVKPYKGDMVLDEVRKAVAVDWAGKLLERPAVACERLKISESDYYTALSSAGTAMDKNIKLIVDGIAARQEERTMKEPLQQILNQSAALGMPVLKTVTEGLVRAIATKQTPGIQAGLRGLKSIQQMLRQRGLEYMRVKEMAESTNPLGAARGVAIAKPKPQPQPAAASHVAVFARATAHAPVWTFREAFARLEGRAFFASGELAVLAREWVEQAPLREMIEAQRFIAGAPYASIEDVVAGVEELPGFKALFLKISARLGAGGAEVEPDGESEEESTRHALDRLGIYRTIVLVAAARVARAGQVRSPLALGLLLEHTLAVGILSYEIGRMLRVPDEHLPAAAGLVHDSGKWLFALAAPGMYALALSLAQSPGWNTERAEQGLFGATHEEAGRLCMEAAGAPTLLLETVSAHDDLERISKPDAMPAVAAVYLANHLAWAAVSEEQTHSQSIREALTRADNPVWLALEGAGIALPMDPPELIEAMARVAKTTAWISATLAEWAGREG